MPDDYVDLVYLDPPFNKNRNFAAPIGSKAAGAAFKDTWTLDDVDLAWHGELAEDRPALYQTIDAAGTAHSKGMKAYLIYMAVRLLELKRVLAPTGSLYLHCDPTASHYLKALMDSVFGRQAFLSEITWKRGSAHSDTKQGRRQHGRIHDVLLYYSAGKEWTWNPVYTAYDNEYIDSFYRHKDPDGRRYRKGDLTAAKPGGDTQYEWRVKRPSGGGEWEADLTEEWETPKAGWEYRGVPPYKGRYWAYSREKMRGFAEQGRLSYAKTGMPNYKRYLDEMPGVPLQDLWTDIPFALGKQRTGYPTQKPLALLDRIIRASSNEGDLVLDPFCGCATACVAAERLNRQWIGIDISDMAYRLVKERLTNEVSFMGTVLHDIQYWTAESSTEAQSPPKPTSHKHLLYGEQEGRCAMCSTLTAIRLMDLDHVVPRAKGGGDELDNLQLLCRSCNLAKGTGEDSAAKTSMIAELREKIAWLENR